MKVLHIVPSYLPAYRHGGPIFSVHALNKWLVKLGVEVTVYTTNIDGPEKLDVPLDKEVYIDGVRVRYFPISYRPWEYSRAMGRALARETKNFDLVHITSVFLSVSSLGARSSKKFMKPYIISPRGSLMREPLSMKSAVKKKLYMSLIEKGNLRGASAIHFTAEQEKQEYEELGFPIRRSVIIPNGYEPDFSGVVTTDVRKKYGFPADAKIVLSLGRINWKKGFDTLIPAFAEITRKIPEARLLIAGSDDGGCETRVKSMISEFKIGDRTVFAGMILNEEKEAVLQQSDVFVLPSYSENFGMAVAEAMYHSLPVVVTDAVGISEEIRITGAGTVVKKDVGEVRDALSGFLVDEGTRKEAGARGHALVVEKFSIESVARKMLGAYEEIVVSEKKR